MRKRLSALVALVVALVSVGVAPAVALDERVIDVVRVGWSGARPLAAGVEAVAQIINEDVNARWLSYTRLVGDPKDRAISFKTGKVLAETINLLAPMPCVGAASNNFMNQIRTESYKRLGITDYKERYLIIVSANAGCVWSGRAQLGEADSKSGILVLHDSDSAFVIAHELGHTFGLGHTSFLRCDSGSKDGAWGSDCKAVEYGGTIDVMGNVETPSPLSTYHQWRMGYLDVSQIRQSYRTETIQLAPSDFADGTRAIFIRDGNAVYWVEYRRVIPGVTYNAGLVIYRIDPPPPASFVSPNPEDNGTEFGQGVGDTVWMLNLDNYRYVLSKASGSMTGNSAELYSGKVSISAVASGTGAAVTVTRRVNATVPATPVLTEPNTWRFPSSQIIKSGSEDTEGAIADFEALIDGVVTSVTTSAGENWSPTYFNPFSPPKNLRLRDLPEGSYSLAVRSIDLAGIKSEWSQTVKAVIDRADPIVANNFVLTGVNANELSLQWKGASDAGSGICQVNVVDEDGLVVQSSSVKNAPSLKVAGGSTLTGTAQIFDCLGNGVATELSVTGSVVAGDKSAKTGKWSPASDVYGAGAVACVGRCTASLSVTGKNDVLVGAGAATVTVGSNVVGMIPNSKVAKLRIGTTFDVGPSRKVMRITGSNFVLIGVASVRSNLGKLRDLERIPTAEDPSLSDDKQVKLAKLGFRAGDFSQEWTVLPMGGGTRLDDPSLDLCNGDYPSEKERTQRRQVAVVKTDSTFAFLSTEVVKYSSVSAATAAHKELVKVVAKCRIDKGYKTSTGEIMVYDFKALPNIPPGVVAEGNRVFVHAVIDTGARARTLLGFYQFAGDTFTGLYVSTSQEVTETQISKWLKVAATMGQRLQGKSG